MNLHHFLEFFFRHNAIFIEVLFGIALAAVIFLTMRSFAQPEDASAGVNLQSLEEGIKKILENHAQGGHAAHSEAGDHAQDEVIETLKKQVEELKDQLVHKHEELEQFKSQSSASTGGEAVATSEPAAGGSGDTAALETKVKDLEARLAEYAVIEDDIADISLYKEENARLSAELDQMKSKMTKFEAEQGVARSIPPLELMPAPVETPSEPAVVEPLETSKKVEEVVEAPAAEVQTAIEEKVVVSDAADDAIMAEFEKAVSEQKAEAKAEADAKAAENPQEGSSEPIKGDIDLDKMMTEAASLPADAGQGESPNALEQTMNTEKLLEEAAGMEKVDSEALNKFDEFLKKEGA